MTKLTVPEIAERLGCTQDHVRALIRSGRIEATKPARGWRATPEAVDAFEESTSNRAPVRRRRRRT